MCHEQTPAVYLRPALGMYEPLGKKLVESLLAVVCVLSMGVLQLSDAPIIIALFVMAAHHIGILLAGQLHQFDEHIALHLIIAVYHGYIIACGKFQSAILGRSRSPIGRVQHLDTGVSGGVLVT